MMTTTFLKETLTPPVHSNHDRVIETVHLQYHVFGTVVLIGSNDQLMVNSIGHFTNGPKLVLTEDYGY